MTTTAARVACLVCDTPNHAPVYSSDGAVSVSSTARPIAVPTVVYVCNVCAHVQTPPLDDIGNYYDIAYNVHLESDASDDLYTVRAGVPVFRALHQADVALAKLALPRGATVLDYGCGKGMSLRAVLAARPDLQGALFDVSDAYRTAWDALVPVADQATYAPPASWNARFDAVLSFFALEHVSDPHRFLAAIRSLLRPGGALHLTVPNVRRNVGDLIVVDHVNHFMPTSLLRLLTDAGFSNVSIDEEAHAAAFVVNARRGASFGYPSYEEAEVAEHISEAQRIAEFWRDASEAVAHFESKLPRRKRFAVYGSGFYGVFIASRLRDRGELAYFLDRNPHQQRKRIFDRPVIAPEDVGDDIEVVYVGLNPERARSIVAAVPALHARAREFFFL